MISIFGDRSFKGKQEKIRNATCSKCNSTNSLELTCYHSYYHIFFIPVFPNKKQLVTQCSNCGDIQNVDPKENKLVQDFSKRNTNPIWMWVGLPIYLALFIWIGYSKLNPSPEDIVQECFVHINPTKIYEIESNGKKQLLLIKYTDNANGKLGYALGKSMYNLNENITITPEKIDQEFKKEKAIDITVENFKKLPIVKCY